MQKKKNYDKQSLERADLRNICIYIYIDMERESESLRLPSGEDEEWSEENPSEKREEPHYYSSSCKEAKNER